MDNISDILSSLSEKDIENLKEAAKSVFPDSGESGSKSSAKEDSTFDFSSIDPQMIAKISKIMSSMNKKNPRCDFIASLKPLLSGSKQHKADEALQMLKLFEILPIIKQMK